MNGSMIREAIRKDAQRIARLHVLSLHTGFLARLGLNFLTIMYRYLIEKECVVVYTSKDQIVGFISGSTDSGRMMKRFILSSPKAWIVLGFVLLKHPLLIKNLLETLRAPQKSDGTAIPRAELLSIAVDPATQAVGIGTKLIPSLDHYFKSRGIRQYKVIAGASLIGANKFYQKNGFLLAGQLNIHGDEPSNIYLRILE